MRSVNIDRIRKQPVFYKVHFLEGYCDGDNYWPPRCTNCTLAMGAECEYDCIHGVENPPFSSFCECEACYDDFYCSVECNNVGSCAANVTSGLNVGFYANVIEIEREVFFRNIRFVFKDH